MRVCIAALCLSAGAAHLLPAQTDASMANEVKQAYKNVKNNLIKSADKMPDADYTFKPTPDIRSYAEVLGHVVVAQSRSCSAAAGDGKPIDMTGKTSKADVTAGLKDAFAICDKAYDALTDANATEAIKTPRGQMTRGGLLTANIAHDSEQYGIIAMYLRMKGLVPPSSDKK